MKYFLSVVAFLVILIVSTKSFAFDTSVKGFLALDLLNMTKIQNKSTALESGIGVLDLKIFAEQGSLSSKFKLDLDDSKLGDPYNIFEEATASYKFASSYKLTAGKGVVPFHRMHWGALENSYLDGGTVMDIHPYWSDIDNKLILSLKYNNKDLKFSNAFTFWGNSQDFKRDSNGDYPNNPADLTLGNNKTFVTSDQWGVANKFEFYPAKNWEFSLSGVVFHHDLNPGNSWAVDTGFGYETQAIEVWFETMYGYGRKNIKESYASFRKYDNTYQLGTEIYGNDLFNYVFNLEYARTIDYPWANYYSGANIKTNATRRDDYQSAKLDMALKWKIEKSAHIAFGVVNERVIREVITTTGTTKTTTNAIEVGTSLSFWF